MPLSTVLYRIKYFNPVNSIICKSLNYETYHPPRLQLIQKLGARYGNRSFFLHVGRDAWRKNLQCVKVNKNRFYWWFNLRLLSGNINVSKNVGEFSGFWDGWQFRTIVFPHIVSALEYFPSSNSFRIKILFITLDARMFKTLKNSLKII